VCGRSDADRSCLIGRGADLADAGSSTSSTLRVAVRAESENGAWAVTATAALSASACAAVKFTGGSDALSASP